MPNSVSKMIGLMCIGLTRLRNVWLMLHTQLFDLVLSHSNTQNGNGRRNDRHYRDAGAGRHRVLYHRVCGAADPALGPCLEMRVGVVSDLTRDKIEELREVLVCFYQPESEAYAEVNALCDMALRTERAEAELAALRAVLSKIRKCCDTNLSTQEDMIVRWIDELATPAAPED